MRKILFIARDDVSQINSSVLAKIFIALLISIPLLFTWFNVLATWDPFANSNQLKIAVINNDEGYKSDVLNIDINVGDIVIKELAINEDLHWVITNEKAGLNGTRSGEYYAAIILPEDFSRTMFTFYAGGAVPADIKLYTNEKKNPLSANLTSQVTQETVAQINNAFSRTLANAAVGLARTASDYLDDSDTQATLDRLSNRLEFLSSELNSGADTVYSLSALIGSSIPLAAGASNLAGSVSNSFDEATALWKYNAKNGEKNPFANAETALGDSLNLASSNIENLNRSLDSLLVSAGSTIEDNAEILEQIASRLDKQIVGFQKTRDAIAGALNGRADDSTADAFIDTLDEAIARQQTLSKRLGSLAGDLRQGIESHQDSQAKAQIEIRQARDAIDAARANLENNLLPTIKRLRSSLDKAARNSAVVKTYMDSVRAALAENNNNTIEILRQSQSSLAQTANTMRDSSQRLGLALNNIEQARNSGDLKKVAEALGADPNALAKLISSPITVQRSAIFPVATFGVGMTPLFAVIALWVGALLAGAFLRTDVSPNVARRYVETTMRNLSVKTTTKEHALENGQTVLDGVVSHRGEDEANVEIDNTDDHVEEEENLAPDKPEETSEKVSEEETHLREETTQLADIDRVFTNFQEYLGRYAMFWLVGMAQSTFLMGGLIVFVDIRPAHPFLLILAGWIISTVFTLCIHTLVVALSNAGKAVAVVLLVLQISAAGGAYPLEMLPQWFQNISPWLPATYAINMMRSAIAGEFAGDYLQNAGMLLLFVIPNLLIGMVLRRAAAKTVSAMTTAIEQTKVM